MTAEDIERVYSYLLGYGRLGAHPYQLAKALNLSQDAVMLALESLRRQGKISLRSTNIEWKARHSKRSQEAHPLYAKDIELEPKRTPPAEE